MLIEALRMARRLESHVCNGKLTKYLDARNSFCT